MKNTVFNTQFSIIRHTFWVLMLCVGCDGMKTELDVNSIAFPPKLCVTAILDGASGSFSIVISEGRSLADYKTPRLPELEIIRNGEIRLYEDDRLILSEGGEFDLGNIIGGADGVYDVTPQRGHLFETAGIVARPGSTYLLEVEVDGYQTITSTSTMPVLSVVSATIDTTVFLKKANIKGYGSLQGWNTDGFSSGFYFWPVSLQWGERAAGRNYYALEMIEETTVIEGNLGFEFEGKKNCGIFVGDLSKLQDNPEVEFFGSEETDLDTSASIEYDLYRFPILLMSDMNFTSDNASLALYKTQVETYGQHFPPGYERLVYQNTLVLRVRHITEATFKYYRSLALQSIGMGFFSEPANIVSNIKNGYGGFTVFSSVDIQLMEYKTYGYQKEYW